MASSKWTVTNIQDLSGKCVIVTGSNRGIGFEAAKVFASKGAQTIIACKDLIKGKIARDCIYRLSPSAKVDIMSLNLANLASVHTFADEYKKKYDRLDILCNSAGVMAVPKGKTADGFEMHFGVNYLGHFALTALLFDLILNTPRSRVVNVSSDAHRFGRINFKNLNAEKSYNAAWAYTQSKLAQQLFTYELQKRFQLLNSNALSVSCHPGIVKTEIHSHFPTAIKIFMNWLGQPSDIGALPILFAATELGLIGGDYIGPCSSRGSPQPEQASRISRDIGLSKALWDHSEHLVGLTFKAF